MPDLLGYNETKDNDEFKKEALTNYAILCEIRKCKESPYYFATKYLLVNGQPFHTMMSEDQFNRVFKNSI